MFELIERKRWFDLFYSSFISYIITFSKYNRRNYLIEKYREVLNVNHFVYKSYDDNKLLILYLEN